jgi:hypothetical protein
MLLAALQALTVAAAVAGIGQSPAVTDDFTRLSADQLKSGIEKQHPAAYYVLAGKLFGAGEKDEAVFWFYAGQLRYRFHLAANPNLPPSGDAALFASLSEVVGRPINEYAFGDLPQLVATLDKVMAWDERTANDFTSRTAHADAWKRIRAGLGELRTHITRNGDQLRAQRKQNGLENRTP